MGKLRALLALGMAACSVAQRAEAPAPDAAAPAATPAAAPAVAVAEPVPVIPAVAAVAAHIARPAVDHLELTFVGDVMFGGTFHGQFHTGHVPENDPLALVEALLASDLALANLETTVVTKVPDDLEGDLRFAATPAQIAILPRHGIGAVTIANNHANDLGTDGVIQTPAHLAALGIETVGEAHQGPILRIETLDVRGWRIGVIAATALLNRPQDRHAPRIPRVRNHNLERALVPLIRRARADHDLVIVVLHWGEQFVDEPDRHQVRVAHAFIDAGADAVIGSHPHVLQAIERYKGGVIAYSLGNFVFRSSKEVVRDTGVLRLGFSRRRRCLDLVAFHPAVMNGHGAHHPVPASGHGFRDVARRLTRLSLLRPLAPTRWVVEAGRLITRAACAQ